MELNGVQEVAGSNPVAPTITGRDLGLFQCCLFLKVYPNCTHFQNINAPQASLDINRLRLRKVTRASLRLVFKQLRKTISSCIGCSYYKPAVGIEPTISSLRVTCSTIEPRGPRLNWLNWLQLLECKQPQPIIITAYYNSDVKQLIQWEKEIHRKDAEKKIRRQG